MKSHLNHSRILRNIVALVCLLLASCTPAQLAGLRTANVIANGVACGIAAANETPCTSTEALKAIARDAVAAQQKVEAVVPQAAATDPAMTALLVQQLAANTTSNEALTKALLDLATRGPLPQYDLPPLAPPPSKPTGAPLAPLPPPTILSPAPPKLTPLEMLRAPLGRVY